MSVHPPQNRNQQDWVLPVSSYIVERKPYKPHVAKSARGNRVMLDKNALIYSTAAKSAANTESIEAKFHRLAEEWRKDIRGISDSEQIQSHPAYQRIFTLGEAAIPLILKEYQASYEPWDYALWIITEEDPVKPKDYGRMDRIAKAWLSWGKEKGYI